MPQIAGFFVGAGLVISAVIVYLLGITAGWWR